MSEIDLSKPLVCYVDDIARDVCFCRVMCNGDVIIEYINPLGSKNWCFVPATRVATDIRNKPESKYRPYNASELHTLVGKRVRWGFSTQPIHCVTIVDDAPFVQLGGRQYSTTELL